jgi:hypothetical protein
MGNYIGKVTWCLPNVDFVKFDSRNEFNWTTNRYEARDYGHSIQIQAVSNAGEVRLSCEYEANGAVPQYMTITVINDLVQMTRHKVEAPSVGAPLSTPQIYLKSNCGSQVFQNSMNSPNTITNRMVSATIQNTFSAGYAIAASGDPPVQIPTSYLNNLDFQLVDANFFPIELLNPMYLTISVTPVPLDANNDLSQWVGRLPLNAQTPAEKAQSEAEAKAQAEAQAQAEAEAKEKAETQELAYQLVVQVLAPIAQQQMVQQQVAMAQLQLQQVKQGIVQNLLQEPDVLEFIKEMPEKKAIKFLDKLANDIIKQGAEEEDENDTPALTDGAPIEQPIEQPETVWSAEPTAAETPSWADFPPQEPQPETETVQEQAPQEPQMLWSLEDLPLSGQM